MPMTADRPRQARKARSAAAVGEFYPRCPSPPGRPPDSREVAVRFHDRRPDGTGFAPSARFNGQVDIRYAQGASDRDGRDASPCFVDGTAVPLCSHPRLGSAPAACCDRHGIRTHRNNVTVETSRPMRMIRGEAVIFDASCTLERNTTAGYAFLGWVRRLVQRNETRSS